MNEIFNETARRHYVTALANWKSLNESAVGTSLNAAREALLDGRHFTELTDADTRLIMPDLSVQDFYRLYGDPIQDGKRSYSDWIQDKELAGMAERHLKLLAPHYGSNDLKVA